MLFNPRALFFKSFKPILKYLVRSSVSCPSHLSACDFPVDFKALQSESVLKKIENNIQARKGVGNIRKACEIKRLIDAENDEEKKSVLFAQLLSELNQLPNNSHPIVETYKDSPHVLKPAKRLKHEFYAKEFQNIAKNLNLLRTEALAALCGPRSYFFLGDLAALEHALVRFFVSNVLKKKFRLITVPDILPASIIENCGMAIRGERSQVYFLDERHGKNLCLSGTAEMALAGLIVGRTFEPCELPLLLTAVSRCYRSETSNVAEERGIYRVHQFTKVEMFVVCEPEKSDELLSHILAIEEENFRALELDFQVLDMPLHELGAPAYRKHDIEAWFPGRQSFGEISSCSNCTNYQARRFQARVRRGADLVHVHTLNGTACAIPRMVMALLETHQQKNGTVRIPDALRPFFGKSEIREVTPLPKLKLKRK